MLGVMLLGTVQNSRSISFALSSNCQSAASMFYYTKVAMASGPAALRLGGSRGFLSQENSREINVVPFFSLFYVYLFFRNFLICTSKIL